MLTESTLPPGKRTPILQYKVGVSASPARTFGLLVLPKLEASSMHSAWLRCRHGRVTNIVSFLEPGLRNHRGTTRRSGYSLDNISRDAFSEPVRPTNSASSRSAS